MRKQSNYFADYSRTSRKMTSTLRFLVSNEFGGDEVHSRMDGVIPQESNSEEKASEPKELKRKRARSERLRANALNMALNLLFDAIPEYFRRYYMWKKKGREEGRASKKDILEMAMRYIRFLNEILDDDYTEHSILSTLMDFDSDFDLDFDFDFDFTNSEIQ